MVSVIYEMFILARHKVDCRGCGAILSGGGGGGGHLVVTLRITRIGYAGK
jgi:ribosomal protein S27E